MFHFDTRDGYSSFVVLYTYPRFLSSIKIAAFATSAKFSSCKMSEIFLENIILFSWRSLIHSRLVFLNNFFPLDGLECLLLLLKNNIIYNNLMYHKFSFLCISAFLVHTCICYQILYWSEKMFKIVFVFTLLIIYWCLQSTSISLSWSLFWLT